MGVQVEVNCPESNWKYLAMMYRHEGNSCQAGILKVLWEQPVCKHSQNTKFLFAHVSKHLLADLWAAAAHFLGFYDQKS